MSDLPPYSTGVGVVHNISLTWDTSAQRYNRNSRDGILETYGATKMVGQISDNRRQNANPYDGYDKACPSAPDVGGWHKRKEDFPEDGEEVHDVI